MPLLYGEDLAYIQAAGFGDLARGAAAEVIGRLRTASISVRNVVEVGCGAGPLTKALTEAGFDVTAIDPSPELLAAAAATAPAAHFINASVYDVDIPRCEAILAIGEPLTYHDPSADAPALLARFFQSASEALPFGGLLIFDVVELGAPPLTGRYWNSGDDWAVMAETTEDQSARRLVRSIETFRRVGEFYRRGSEIHQVRLFDAPALSDQLRSLGFTVETASRYGSYPLPPRRRAFFASRAPAGSLSSRS